ncbi:MAG: leucine-rich repeat domain-containing protein [Oscillospiraceae bacterium]
MAKNRFGWTEDGSLIVSMKEEHSGSHEAKKIIIPEGTTTIEENAFYDHFRPLQVNAFVIPETVTTIKARAFRNCRSLTAIIIPEGVTSIGDEAFAECIQLRSVVLPESLISIGKDAFLGTPWLKKQMKFFRKFQMLGKNILLQYTGNDTHISIPKNVKYIAGGAFAKQEQLVSIKIPEHVQQVGNGAFFHCLNLKEVEIAENVKILGEEIFAGCTALEKIKLPEDLLKLRQGAFRDCIRLKEVTFPIGLTEIGEEAFQGCTMLTECEFPDTVRVIGESAFRNCRMLKKLHFPKRLVCVNDHTFEGCRSLQKAELPEMVCSIGENAFYGCISLESVSISKEVRYLGEKAFFDCKSLQSVWIPERIPEIATEAFRGCQSLEIVTICTGVEVIREKAFKECTSLHTVTMGNGIKAIETEAFYGCISLEKINIPETIESFGIDAFEKVPWFMKNQETFLILGRGILMAYHGTLSHVKIPENVRKIEDHVFNVLNRPKVITLSDNVESMNWQYIPGLTLILQRKGHSVKFKMDDKHYQAGRDEERVFEFWQKKHTPTRHRIFHEMRDPIYKFPIAILMYLTEPNDEFYEYYVHRNMMDLLQYMIEHNDLENLREFVEKGFVNSDNIDNLLDIAIESSQHGGSLEIQMFLMDYKSSHIGYQSIEDVIAEAFNL